MDYLRAFSSSLAHPRFPLDLQPAQPPTPFLPSAFSSSLPPLQDVNPRQDAQNAKQNQRAEETDLRGNGGTSQRTAQNGKVQNDGVPRQVRRTVIGRDAFEHVVGIRAIGPCPGEAAEKGDGIELPDLMRERQQKRVERHAHYAPAGHPLMTEAVDDVPQLHRADEHGEVIQRLTDAERVIVQFEDAHVVLRVDRGGEVVRQVEGKERQQNFLERRGENVEAEEGGKAAGRCG